MVEKKEDSQKEEIKEPDSENIENEEDNNDSQEPSSSANLFSTYRRAGPVIFRSSLWHEAQLILNKALPATASPSCP